MNRELLQPVSLVDTAAASVGGDVILYGKIQKQGVTTSSSGHCSDDPGSSSRNSSNTPTETSATDDNPVMTCAPKSSNASRNNVNFIGPH